MAGMSVEKRVSNTGKAGHVVIAALVRVGTIEAITVKSCITGAFVTTVSVVARGLGVTLVCLIGTLVDVSAVHTIAGETITASTIPRAWCILTKGIIVAIIG